jgi:hypothetical protein
MPNWVNNSLVIFAKPDVITKMREQLSAPYPSVEYDWQTKETTTVTVNEPFSFWNIIKPTNLTAYYDSPADESQRHPDHWYAWNINNWGCKWEARDVEEHSEDEGELVFTFSTPWGVPELALLELSRQYPTASIENEFEEESGWGGETHYVNGVETEVDGYNYRCYACDMRWAGNPSDLTWNDDGQHNCKADEGKVWQPLTEEASA